MLKQWVQYRTPVVVLVWITAILFADRGASLPAQYLLGAATWLVLVALLRSETALVRLQVLVVVVFATLVEYTFSGMLHVYVYRLGNVPSFVPPGHGLVYLAALALGRSDLFRRHCSRMAVTTVCAGGVYAAWGLSPLAPRLDVLGAFWFCCLAGFLLLGPSRSLYVGAFLVVTYLEVLGTSLHSWTWQVRDPTGLVPIGSPPSGAAGGYGWFDLVATLAGPWLLAAGQSGLSRRRTGAWSKPLVLTALPSSVAFVPSTEVSDPPASDTMGTSAARSHKASVGSAATSTAPSATSMWLQKSP